MMQIHFSRRDFAFGTGSLLAGLGVAGTALAADSPAPAVGAKEISHRAASIHQEVAFRASPERAYAALTRADQFDKIVKLSGAMRAGMVDASKPTEISPDLGGAFSLFGGYVTGRHVVLMPSSSIIQAWRAGSWADGIYSIARFQIMAAGAGTKLVFDHTGFPPDAAQHLAQGWHENYWEPMTKYLG
jgi:activator of HSP90 ATPase